MISCCLSPIMTHEVHLHRARSSSREFPGRDDGNESQQAPWFCSGSMPPVPSLGFLCPEQPVHGGRPHLEKGRRERIRDHGPVSCHGTQELRHGCLQSLATELPGKVVHPDEPFHYGKTIQILPLSGPWRGSGRHQCHCSQDDSLGIRVEGRHSNWTEGLGGVTDQPLGHAGLRQAGLPPSPKAPLGLNKSPRGGVTDWSLGKAGSRQTGLPPSRE